MLDFPQLTGDGKRSVRQLIETRLTITLGDFAHTAPMPVIESAVSYWGRTLDTVPAAGEKVKCGFSYSSVLEQFNRKNRNALVGLHKTPLEQKLIALGRSVWEFVPEEIRRGVLYIVDAVLDAQDEFWLLEMNPNPGIHPDCYPAMIASVLQKDVSHMPSLSKPTPDAPHMKGQLVWASKTAGVRKGAGLMR